MSRSLNFIIGSTVVLQPVEDEESSYEATLLGYAENRSLMISLPKQGGTPVLVAPGDRFIARCVGDENTFAFQTEVQQTCDKPFGYLHLTYPTGVQGVMLRKGQRVPVSSSATPGIRLSMTDGKDHISVAMADISATGARLISDQRLGDVNDSFSIDMQVQAGREPVTLPCTIRYVRSGEDEFQHGVMFKELSTDAQLFINRFITDHIQLQRTH